MYHAKREGRQMYEFFRPEMLLDPEKQRSNEAEPIAGQGSQGFSFRTMVFPFASKLGPH